MIPKHPTESKPEQKFMKSKGCVPPFPCNHKRMLLAGFSSSIIRPRAFDSSLNTQLYLNKL
jgi:hypothetical protein